MNKLHLSNHNFLIVQHRIYQLEDEWLLAHAELALADLDSWINKHFELKPEEQLDMVLMDKEQKREFAFNISFAITNRLLVNWKKVATLGSQPAKAKRWFISQLEIDWGPLLVK